MVALVWKVSFLEPLVYYDYSYHGLYRSCTLKEDIIDQGGGSLVSQTPP